MRKLLTGTSLGSFEEPTLGSRASEEDPASTEEEDDEEDDEDDEDEEEEREGLTNVKFSMRPKRSKRSRTMSSVVSVGLKLPTKMFCLSMAFVGANAPR